MPSLEEVSHFFDDAEEELRFMVSRVEESKVLIRSSDHRDVVLGAHLSRIATSCACVFLPCRLGFGHDASVLCRVLMEHDISMMFFFAQDARHRYETRSKPARVQSITKLSACGTLSEASLPISL
jgi:hypothetical protein